MLQKLNRVMHYIEAHLLDETLSLAEISDYAGVSDYHFRQIFYYLSGFSLSEYIKYRRLSQAGLELLGGQSVTDVAFKYGYQSIDGFTRAFKQWSGLLPSEVMRTGQCKSLPILHFTLSIQGGMPMEFRIEKQPAFYLAGVSKRVPMQFEGINPAIMELAESITPQQRAEMHRLQNIAPHVIVNASYAADADFLKEEGDLTHLIGVRTSLEPDPSLLDKVAVPALTWAVFPNRGPFPQTLQQTMAKIYAEWLATTHYELVAAPTFSFSDLNAASDDDVYSEIWVAVRPL